VIPEAEDTITLGLEPRISRPIPFDALIEPMLGSINLNHELCGVTYEIRHVRSHWNLAANVEPLEAMRLECMPELAFGRRHRAAQSLGLRAKLRFHMGMRDPIPSPLVGEG
jgi:hypothetical protein